MGWGKHRRSKEIQTTENFLRAVAPSGDASASAGVTMTWTTSCTGKMSPTGRGAYEYQRIPPLISHVPVKIRRTRVGLGVKSSFSPHKGARKSHLPREQIKFQTEELHSIRGELSQIKAQVDRLLENLEHMDQQRDQLPGGTPPTGGPGHIPRSEDSEETRGPGSKGSSCRITELQQEPRGQRAHPEADSSEDSTDPEETVSEGLPEVTVQPEAPILE
ncbi:uncharacterized protein LOC103673565 isoform X1 [Ursus maritimus]|uniref:Uncharacterized protein LOC103673565 isoform X1 n=1 Tax=Ursus maritimus TaxID=29073 RepID=A0A8M1G1K4_URSMA|nr:uncharacterized protein LOC103673565 isoform X1 [Ursus maritimus]